VRLPNAAFIAKLAAICFVSVLVRAPFRHVPLTTDEGGYAYVAYWQRRGLRLYRELWFDRPQAIFALYGAMLRVLGESTSAIRLGAGAYNALTTALVGILACSWWGRRAGLSAAAIFGVSSASPVLEGFTANGELFMAAPVLLSVILAERRHAFLAGLSTALATGIKPTAMPSALAPIVTLRTRPQGLVEFLAGLALGLGLTAAHGFASSRRAYLEAVLGFRLKSHSALALRADLMGALRWSAPESIIALLPVWWLAALGILRRGNGVATASALLVGSLAGVASGGSWFWHYYLGVLPAASLLAARG
jgi:hypothetical protein